MPQLGPGARADIGGAILTAAALVDTHLIKDRLARFRDAHRRYAEAQKIVEKAEADLVAAQARINSINRDLGDHIEKLARALMNDGHGRANPFRAFGGPTSAAMARLALPSEARAAHRLIAAIRRHPSSSSNTLTAAAATEAIALTAERELEALAVPRAARRAALVQRNVIALDWNRRLSALRLGAQVAADDGAPDLERRLFQGIQRDRRTFSKRRRGSRRKKRDEQSKPGNP